MDRVVFVAVEDLAAAEGPVAVLPGQTIGANTETKSTCWFTAKRTPKVMFLSTENQKRTFWQGAWFAHKQNV